MIRYVQDLGQNQAKTTGTTTVAISFAGTTKPAVGDLVVIYCSRDNVVSDPLSGDSFSDGTANSYSRVIAGSSVATAAAGQVGIIFYCVLTVAFASGTNTLTWTHPSMSTGNGARGLRGEHFTGATGLRASGTTTGTSTTGAPSAANTTPVAGDLVCGVIASEDTNATAITGDSDLTNGAWSTITQFGTTGSTAATNSKVGHQYKMVHTTGTQTYNPTTTSADAVTVIATFQGPGYAGPDGPMERAADTGTVLWHDGFDGTALSSFWTGDVNTGGSVAVSNSQLALKTGTLGAYTDYARVTTDDLPPCDFEMHGLVTIDAGNGIEYFPTIGVRADGTWSGGDSRIQVNDYHMLFDVVSPEAALQESISGVNSYIQSDATYPPYTGNSSHRFRIRLNGPSIRFKWWHDGANEPTDWVINVVNYDHSGPDRRQIYISLLGGNTAAVRYMWVDYLTVTSLASSRPSRQGFNP